MSPDTNTEAPSTTNFLLLPLFLRCLCRDVLCFHSPFTSSFYFTFCSLHPSFTAFRCHLLWWDACLLIPHLPPCNHSGPLGVRSCYVSPSADLSSDRIPPHHLPRLFFLFPLGYGGDHPTYINLFSIHHFWARVSLYKIYCFIWSVSSQIKVLSVSWLGNL